MRDQETRSVRFISVLEVALAVGVLLAFASSAAAVAPSGAPVRFWSVSKIQQGAGEANVASGAQDAGVLHRVVDLGLSAFNFGKVGSNPDPYNSPVDGRASGEVFSSADGARYSVAAQAPLRDFHQANSSKGGVTHLDEYQAYEKRSGDASLRITITDAVLEAIDDSRAEASECVQIIRCFPIRSVVRFHARAYAASAGGDFFNVGGIAFVTGHFGAWEARVATSADSQAPLWTSRDFLEVLTCADPACFDELGPADTQYLLGPHTVKIPLASVRTGELFGVHVSLEAEAVDDRGVESGALAYLRDPQERGPALLQAHGLTPRGKPKFKEPTSQSPKPAKCAAKVPRHAGTVQLDAPRFTASESDRDPLVLVTRKGGSRGEISATVRTSGGSAQSGKDFKATSTRVTFGNGDTSSRFVEIPIREDKAAESQENFTVALSHPQCGTLGKQRHASVTILDDDQPPPPPLPTFTIGGTVDGLAGSGLVLTNAGADVPVSADGSFTFPGTAPAGQPYDVEVRTQPSNPRQVCTVQGGKGTVSNANVTDVAVHCTTPLVPLGLDTSFGNGGLVSTPVGGLGQAEAVVIQPTGGIVAAGWRTVSTGGATDFALTRYDQSGNLDPTFGTNGIATTDLGGDHDQAFGAAVLPDNGIVAVGRTNALGILKTAFGVVRYLPDGTPNTNFGKGGIVTTPFFGMGAQAKAVAVQPDGKIVVAGSAFANSVDEDFAVARYNADGSLDDNFGDHGVVTTDLGTDNDFATGVAIESDGKIVLGGNATEDVGLVRYLPNGSLDPTFGNLGKSVTKIGLGADVNGVALDSAGGILIAGSTVGAISQSQDFLLAGFRGDGTLNMGFGHFGFVTTDFGHGDDFAENLLVDDQGEIVLVGRATSDTITDLALATYRPDGSLADFGRGGIFTADFHGRGDGGQDLVIDSQNRIIAAGFTANGGDTEFALTRVFR